VSEREIRLAGGTYTARPYREGDEARVLELWRTAFGRELEPAVWRWKYADNPFGRRILLCCDASGAAVVVYSGAPYRAVWNGRRVEIVQLMDIMSHPEVRKTGLFVKAAEIFFELFAGGDSVLYYGIPGRYHFDIGAKYLAYSGLPSGVACLEAATAGLAAAAPGARGAAAELARPGRELDRLWSDLEAHFPLAAVRDAAFADWRFRRHPTRRYRLWAWRSGLPRRLRAFAAIAVEAGGARLVDLLAPPDEALVGAFLGQVAARLASEGVARLQTWLPGTHFLSRALERTGWTRVPEPLGIVPTARSFAAGLEIPWVSEHLFYTMADSDLM
jgi:hypothetical protein